MARSRRRSASAEARLAVVPRAASTASRASRMQLGGAALVQHLEMRRHAGLQRESAAAATGRRRGWSRSSCRPARRALGEQLPRAAAHLVARRACRSARAGSSCSSLVRQRRPARQALGDAVAISAAAALVKVRQRMRCGVAPSSSRPQHAVGQHLGLARCRPRPRPRPTMPGSAALRCAVVGSAWCAAATVRAHVSSPSGGRPFLDPRQMVVVAEARRRTPDRGREVGRGGLVEGGDQVAQALGSASCVKLASHRPLIVA